MTTNNWKRIWNSKNGAFQGLDSLIKLDGYDSGAGRIKLEDWRNYAHTIIQNISVKQTSSVFEIGCGAGAFLYALTENKITNVGGIDYAEGLIDVARAAMPHGSFKVCEANAFSTTEKFDFVIASSVFHYFDYDYARLVLDRMIKKSNIAVAILDVPDLKTRDESEAERRAMLTPEEYDKKYVGLAHTYFDRNFFTAQASKYGKICELFDGCVPGYAQNRFRFGCIIRK